MIQQKKPTNSSHNLQLIFIKNPQLTLPYRTTDLHTRDDTLKCVNIMPGSLTRPRGLTLNWRVMDIMSTTMQRVVKHRIWALKG